MFIKRRFWALIILISMNVLLTACASMTPLTETHHAVDGVAFDKLKKHEHEALANEFNNKANEMWAKAEEKKVLLKHKSYSSQFGKNRKNAKSRIKYKIHKYEQAAAKYREIADGHQKMAIELTSLQSAESAKVDADKGQLDKAKVILDETSASGNIGKF